MVKVAIVFGNSSYNYEEDAQRLISQSITDWVEVSPEDLKVLQSVDFEFGWGGYNYDLMHVVVKLEEPQNVTVDNILELVKKEIKERKLREQEEMEKRQKKLLAQKASKKLSQKEKDLKKFEELQKKLFPKP